MPEPAIIKAIVRAVEQSRLAPQARILDLSCGDGEILEALARLGFRLEGTHYRNDDYIFDQPSAILAAIPVHKGVDLTRPLPFADGSFDVVLATEVLEHLPAHAPLVAEVGRILAPGGRFIFTTPNVHRLSNRARFFLAGSFNLSGARLGWHVPRQDLYSTHFTPVYFPVFHTLLHHHDLHVERMLIPSCMPWDLLLLPLYPLLAAATALDAAHAIRRSPDGGRDLRRWMVSPAMFLGKQIVAVARRSALSAPPA
jgi:SAM-dependent methyltransferase